jgi:hypothetical protein
LLKFRSAARANARRLDRVATHVNLFGGPLLGGCLNSSTLPALIGSQSQGGQLWPPPRPDNLLKLWRAVVEDGAGKTNAICAYV